MSVMGHKRTKSPTRIMSVNGGKADEIIGKADIGDFMSAFGVTTDVLTQQTRAAVRQFIEIELDKLPELHARDLRDQV